MAQVVLVGCGVVGAAIAYELSQQADLTITVLDRQLPAQGATGAALGILMGIISQKVKGRNWRLREASIRRYQTLLPELAAIGQPVPHNRHGILSLCFEATELPRWKSLQEIRHRQGWPLELWSPQQVANACPHLAIDQVVAGIYSPQDLQIAPKALTHALVQAAQQRGVDFHFEAPVTGFQRRADQVVAVQTEQANYPADWTILTAGLGSSALTHELEQSLPLIPVLGQGLRVRVPQELGVSDFQPVVNGQDIHLVPMGDREYAVAATVEFPETGITQPLPQAAALESLWQGAIAYCPALAQAKILETWYGLRPRPQGQAAPVIKHLEGYTNVILATGHYRNGILLAPATAQLVKSFLTEART
ncbi:MAG: FAD-binding oxidoreductase [Leptolyngbya sp. SIO1E4]|nr:FAD-binding oxidoreductase [Leptolyngbya sp. SIO1E4]